MGGNRHPDGPALPHRPGFGREKVLALCPVRRSAPPHQCRAAAGSPGYLLIAAHALTLGHTVVTDNEREFSRIDDLTIENWLR